jgi:hypothetical protein
VWLLLCASDDRPALWAASRLSARGIDPLVVLTPELLHYSFGWEHRLHSEGRSSVAFTLADGRRIDGAAIRGVLNRMSFLPPHLAVRLVPADRMYTLHEGTALHISWLSSLRAPVLNEPVMGGLCGAWRHESEWVWLAERAGLEAAPYVHSVPVSDRASSNRSFTRIPGALSTQPPAARTVIVVDGRAVDDQLPDDLLDACGRLAALAKTRVLGIDLDARTGRFMGASPRPDLRHGGDAVIDALASALRAAR